MYYDIDGKKITLEKWGKLQEDANYKIICRSIINGYLISTVWLGVDYGRGEGIQIFETMIFKDRDETLSTFFCERYPSRCWAIVGHNYTVKRLIDDGAFFEVGFDDEE